MPFIKIISQEKLSVINKKLSITKLKERIKVYTSRELEVDTFSIEVCEAGPYDELASEIEVRITADQNPIRNPRVDMYATNIENNLSTHTEYGTRIRIFLFLDRIGFDQKKG